MTTAKKAAAPKKTASSTAKAASPAEETKPATTDEAATAAPLEAPADDENTTPGDAEGNDGAEDTTEGTDESDRADDDGSTIAASPAVETGPMTGVPAPPENSARPPAAIVNESPAAAPLDPPADSHLQREPQYGHKTSSTDHTYAEVGGRTIAGENLVALVTRDNQPVDVDDLFEDPGPRFTHMVSKHRVYERFTYPNTKTVDKRLIFAEGAHVPRAQAVRIVAAAKADLAAAEAE